MAKINLYLDFDNTMVNAFKGIEVTYNTLYCKEDGFIPSIGDKIERYNMQDECRLLKLEDVAGIFKSEIFWDNIELFPDVIETLKMFQEYFNYYIVSIGTFENVSRKSYWIEKNLPIINQAIMLASGRNDHCKMDKSCINMHNGILIDDQMANIRSSNASKKICFGKWGDWNLDYEITEAYRCFDWKQVQNMLKWIIESNLLKHNI